MDNSLKYSDESVINCLSNEITSFDKNLSKNFENLLESVQMDCQKSFSEIADFTLNSVLNVSNNHESLNKKENSQERKNSFSKIQNNNSILNELNNNKNENHKKNKNKNDDLKITQKNYNFENKIKNYPNILENSELKSNNIEKKSK